MNAIVLPPPVGVLLAVAVVAVAVVIVIVEVVVRVFWVLLLLNVSPVAPVAVLALRRQSRLGHFLEPRVVPQPVPRVGRLGRVQPVVGLHLVLVLVVHFFFVVIVVEKLDVLVVV